jgi:hypothetical protein
VKTDGKLSKQQWQKIIAAARALGLGERASLEEIKKAYRRLSKQHHPDLAADPESAGRKMHELTEAYQRLLDYGCGYRLPLAPDENEILDDEEWWMNRFGQDPLWGKG